MIPRPIPPLTALSVLVTRPATQGKSLCERIVAAGGEAIAFPAIAIEPIAAAAPTDSFDWIIFTSVNAVEHGLPPTNALTTNSSARIAAIGKATATALKSNDIVADLTAPPPYTSEALLAMPELTEIAGKRVLIVRGADGRTALRDALRERDAEVEYLEIYRRVPAEHSAAEIAEMEQRWAEGGVDVVTLTSAEILDKLLTLLTSKGRDLLNQTPFVAPSARVVAAARAHELRGHAILAPADDDSIVGAIAQWHARAKTQTA